MTPEEVEESTCTELPQKWGKADSSTAKQYLFEPVPVRQFCHLPKRQKLTMWNEDVPDEILAGVKEIMYAGMSSPQRLLIMK